MATPRSSKPPLDTTTGTGRKGGETGMNMQNQAAHAPRPNRRSSTVFLPKRSVKKLPGDAKVNHRARSLAERHHGSRPPDPAGSKAGTKHQTCDKPAARRARKNPGGAARALEPLVSGSVVWPVGCRARPPSISTRRRGTHPVHGPAGLGRGLPACWPHADPMTLNRPQLNGAFVEERLQLFRSPPTRRLREDHRAAVGPGRGPGAQPLCRGLRREGEKPR